MEHTDILPSRKSSWQNDAWKTSDVLLGMRPIFMGKPACSSREDRKRKFLQPKKIGILDIFRNQIFGTVFDLRKVVHSMPISK